MFAVGPCSSSAVSLRRACSADVIDVLSLTAGEATAGDTFTCNNLCLQTRDYTPLEPDPDAEEHKFYVPGLGLIVEVKPATMERLELVEFTPAP